MCMCVCVYSTHALIACIVYLCSICVYVHMCGKCMHMCVSVGGIYALYACVIYIYVCVCIVCVYVCPVCEVYVYMHRYV